MEIASLAFAGLAGFAAVVALVVFMNAVKVSRVRLRPMRLREVELTRVPPRVRSLLDAGRPWLSARGFSYAGSTGLTPLISPVGNEEGFHDVWLDASTGIFAVVSLLERPQAGDAIGVEFQTVFPDRIIATTNRTRHSMVWEAPEVEFHDDYLADLQAALERHRERVKAEGGSPLADPAARLARFKPFVEGYLDRLVEEGIAGRGAEGEVRLRFRSAVKYVWKVMQGNTRAGKVKVVPIADPAAVPALAAEGQEFEAELRAYKARRAVNASMSASGKWGLGAMTAVAFLAVGALLWDPVFAIALLVVIAIHEGGHYLAMKAVGYRNLNVFFVPGLGGLATGVKQDATAVQKVFVYLAGPVPGIFLATAAYVVRLVQGVEWPTEVGTFIEVMLVVNVINLLPITPLDGGRVMEALLFIRWPTLRFLFAAASGALLAGAGAVTGDRVLLILGALVLFGLPQQWRFSRLALKVKRAPGAVLSERSAAQRVFQALAHPSFRSWKFDGRAQAADELISELRAPMPGFLVVTGGLALYAACFILPVAAAVAAMPELRETYEAIVELRRENAERESFREASFDGRPKRDWEGQLAAAAQDPPARRLDLLLAAIHDGFVPPALAESDKLQAEVRRMAGELPAGNAARTRALLFVLEFSEVPDEERRASLRRLMDEVPPGEEFSEARALVLGSLAADLESPQERLQAFRESRDTLRNHADLNRAALVSAWSGVARESDATGDATAAEEAWKSLIDWLATAKGETRDIHMAQTGFLKLLLKKGRWSDAEALVRPGVEEALEKGKLRATPGRLPHVQALFWMAIERNDPQEAARWLAGWESGLTSRGAKHNPQLQVARLAVAELRRDQPSIERARDELKSSRAAKFMCESAGMTMVVYQTPLEPRPGELLRRHGVCG